MKRNMLLIIAANRLAFIEMSQFQYVLIDLPTFPFYLQPCSLAYLSYLPSNSSVSLGTTDRTFRINERITLFYYFFKQEYYNAT